MKYQMMENVMICANCDKRLQCQWLTDVDDDNDDENDDDAMREW